jgi:hypothetical protein
VLSAIGTDKFVCRNCGWLLSGKPAVVWAIVNYFFDISCAILIAVVDPLELPDAKHNTVRSLILRQ